ncbi:MAG: DUF6286 domain-containing protein [Ilumatobacteraceae bacterium]
MTLLRRFLALLVALALAGVAVLVIVETISIRIGESPVLVPIDEWERRLITGDWRRWSADAWTIASASALAVGLVLTLVQLIPHRTTALDRRREGSQGQVRFGRSGLDDRLRDIAVDQDGVIGGKVDVSKRKIKVEAQIPQGADRKATEKAVSAAVRQDLARLRLAGNPRLKVKAVHTDDRVL